MDAAQLKHLVEALVFATDKPLTIMRLRQLTRVSDTKRLEQTLEHMAMHDPLTDLPNRKMYDVELRRARARAERDHHHLALMLLDLDRFKQYNDEHGPQAGDRFLKWVAGIWSRSLRTTDILARHGGETAVLQDAEVAAELHGAPAEEVRVDEGRQLQHLSAVLLAERRTRVRPYANAPASGSASRGIRRMSKRVFQRGTPRPITFTEAVSDDPKVVSVAADQDNVYLAAMSKADNCFAIWSDKDTAGAGVQFTEVPDTTNCQGSAVEADVGALTWSDEF